MSHSSLILQVSQCSIVQQRQIECLLAPFIMCETEQPYCRHKRVTHTRQVNSLSPYSTENNYPWDAERMRLVSSGYVSCMYMLCVSRWGFAFGILNWVTVSFYLGKIDAPFNTLELYQIQR